MSKTFDLSTLNLSAGTHEITVKARASGYADSPASNAVSYVVEGDTVQVSGTWYFNEIPTALKTEQRVLFTSNGRQFYGINGINDGRTDLGYANGTIGSINAYDVVYVSPINNPNNYGWENEAYRTIVFDGEQTVSKEFYEWFTANAERKDTIPVAGGTWRFNDVLNTSYIDGIDVIPLKFYSWDGIDQVFAGEKEYSRIEHDTGQFSWDDTVVAYSSDSKWKNDLYKTISIAKNQTLTQEHYNWLVANAKYVPNN